MGAEQSSTARKKSDQKTMNDMLDQQRRIYEARCSEMLQASRSEYRTSIINQNLPSSSQTSYTHIYPNLSNASQSVSVQPSVSSAAFNIHHQNIVHASMINKASCASSRPNEVQPSAPVEEVAEAEVDVSTRNTIECPRSTSRSRAYGMKQNQQDDELKCHSCNNQLNLYIYQCGQGHSSCKECRVKGALCGVCRNPITDMRNITLEALIADLKLNNPGNSEKTVTKCLKKCPNAGDGCRLSLQPGALKAHLEMCLFREMKCPMDIFNVCSWRGKLNQFKIHFDEIHPEQTLADLDKELNFNMKNKQVLHYVTIGTYNFVVHMQQDSIKQMLFMTVQLIGTQRGAAKWIYEFHVYFKGEPRRKYTYCDTCHSYNTSVNDIYKKFECAAMPLSYVSSFVKDNNFTYKFYIKQDENNKSNYVKNNRRRGRGRS